MSSTVSLGYPVVMARQDGILQTTHWTLVRNAASGDRDAAGDFVRQYRPAVRAYLGARWRNSHLLEDLDDAMQEVFVECFRRGGALERLDQLEKRSFRSFLYGLVRNVARMVERRSIRSKVDDLPGENDVAALESDEESLSRVFDRTWAQTVIREALALQKRRAEEQGEDARLRFALLEARFHENQPVRQLAARWDRPAPEIHRLLARARADFAEALREVIQEQGSEGDLVTEQHCEKLLELLA